MGMSGYYHLIRCPQLAHRVIATLSWFPFPPRISGSLSDVTPGLCCSKIGSFCYFPSLPLISSLPYELEPQLCMWSKYLLIKLFSAIYSGVKVDAQTLHLTPHMRGAEIWNSGFRGRKGRTVGSTLHLLNICYNGRTLLGILGISPHFIPPWR